MKIIHRETYNFLKVAKQLQPPRAVYPQNVDNCPGGCSVTLILLSGT
jgi:hypothetical protein